MKVKTLPPVLLTLVNLNTMEQYSYDGHTNTQTIQWTSAVKPPIQTTIFNLIPINPRNNNIPTEEDHPSYGKGTPEGSPYTYYLDKGARSYSGQGGRIARKGHPWHRRRVADSRAAGANRAKKAFCHVLLL